MSTSAVSAVDSAVNALIDIIKVSLNTIFTDSLLLFDRLYLR